MKVHVMKVKSNECSEQWRLSMFRVMKFQGNGGSAH